MKYSQLLTEADSSIINEQGASIIDDATYKSIVSYFFCK